MSDLIEQRLQDAICRILEGAPLDEKLARKASRGKLSLNFVTVALEAGVSRTLIALEDCAYPKIRAQIVSLKSAKVSLQETIDALVNKQTRLQETILQQRLSLASLMSRLSKKKRRSMDTLARKTIAIEAELKACNTSASGPEIPLRNHILQLREKIRVLELKIAKRDTIYGNLIINAREYEQGKRPDGSRIRRTPKAVRLSSISLVR
jgi:hypothetical protein